MATGPFIGPKGGKDADPAHKIPGVDHSKLHAAMDGGGKAAATAADKLADHHQARAEVARSAGNQPAAQGHDEAVQQYNAAARASRYGSREQEKREMAHAKARGTSAMGAGMAKSIDAARELLEKSGGPRIGKPAEPLAKAGGPYIGPQGGKYADPGHKVHWVDRAELHAKASEVSRSGHPGYVPGGDEAVQQLRTHHAAMAQ